MNDISRRRPLAFEQMEQRLALSAAPVGDYILILDGNWSGLTLQGGSVAFDQVFTGGFTADLGVANGGNFFNRAQDNGFIEIRDGEYIFTGPVFSQPDSEGPLESSEASPVVPIPQPQIGNGEIAEGIIAVAEIFRPVNPSALRAERPLVDEPAVETTLARSADESWKSVSLARARDVYFEVAALSDDHKAGDSQQGELAGKIAPLIYQQSLMRREAERASSTTSEERVNTPRQLPTLPSTPRPESQPVDAARPETSTENAAGEKAQRTAQEGELPHVDEFSQVANPRDEVFEGWEDGNELSDEAIALRTDNQHNHSATWPALAALAVTGWMTRTRRAKGVLPSHRQPLRRK